MKDFFTKNPLVIGMVHFSPLDGGPNFPGKDVVLDRAREDLATLIEGGVDAVLFENNFDNPKLEQLPDSQAKHFEELVKDLAQDLDLPWGLAPLWNDYALGFRLCKTYGGSMVRVPVFVDSVETVYGTFRAEPERVLQEREEQQAEKVAILADVQVKHATMLKPRPMEESLKEAMKYQADAVIITGTWTGDPPSVELVSEAKSVLGDSVRLLTGSGMTSENIQDFLPFLDGCIVGSAFKQEAEKISDSANIFPPEVRYDAEKVKRFMDKVEN